MNFGESIAAEEMRAIRESERYLAEFRDCWRWLSSDVRSSALREALWTLTIAALSNPLQAEIWFDAVAVAAELPKAELRAQIQNRAQFFARFPELHKANPRSAVEVLCNLILN